MKEKRLTIVGEKKITIRGGRADIVNERKRERVGNVVTNLWLV